MLPLTGTFIFLSLFAELVLMLIQLLEAIESKTFLNQFNPNTLLKNLSKLIWLSFPKSTSAKTNFGFFVLLEFL